MGGGSGVIIVQNKRLVIQREVSTDEESSINEISNRSPVTCSFLDALKIISIIWGLLR